MPVVEGISSENYSFKVFSRDGDLVFETNEPGVPWDGSYTKGDYYVQDDVYVWILNVQDSMSADVLTYRGHVTILR